MKSGLIARIEQTLTDAGLEHMSFGFCDRRGCHAVAEFQGWELPAYTSPPLGDFGKLYLYAKCGKSSEVGEFILSEEPHDMDEGSNYYFLVGLLGSQADGVRSFATVYGFTEILPGRITVDRLISPDG